MKTMVQVGKAPHRLLNPTRRCKAFRAAGKRLCVSGAGAAYISFARGQEFVKAVECNQWLDLQQK